MFSWQEQYLTSERSATRLVGYLSSHILTKCNFATSALDLDDKLPIFYKKGARLLVRVQNLNGQRFQIKS